MGGGGGGGAKSDGEVTSPDLKGLQVGFSHSVLRKGMGQHKYVLPSDVCDRLQLYTPSRTLRSASDTLGLQIARTRHSTVGSRDFSVFGPSAWNDLPLRPTEILSGLLQIKHQDVYFSGTVDLPYFPFRAGVFLCLKSVCLFELCVNFCIVSVLLGACVCVRTRARDALRTDSMDKIFALYKYFNYYCFTRT